MNAKEIVYYLTLVGKELGRRGQQEPIELLMIGGGYVLTQVRGGRKTTRDIDVVWIQPEFYAGSAALRRFEMAIEYIAISEGLDSHWLNIDPHDFVSSAGELPETRLWRQFGPLFVYIPPKDFILAHKLISARDKDMPDIELLCRQLRINTRRKAQQLVDKYIDELAQEVSHTTQKLDELFGR